MTRIIGILSLILIIAGTVWYVIYTSSPSEEEITSKETTVTSIDTEIVDPEVLKQLDELEQNGKLPVTVAPKEIGKTSPFTP
ncbi:hypothetical protein ACFL14_01920 [Patescibacteria group bacterium]